MNPTGLNWIVPVELTSIYVVYVHAVWTADGHASPAEADKSFLLPLTSSMLRAKESISEHDLEASPLAHKKSTHKKCYRKKKKKHLWNYLGGFLQDLRESRWVDVASKHRLLLSYLYFLLNVSSGSDLTADQSVEATSLCKQVGGGVVFMLPETGAHR